MGDAPVPPAQPRTCGECLHLTQGLLWGNPWRCHQLDWPRATYIKRDDPRAATCQKWKARGA